MVIRGPHTVWPMPLCEKRENEVYMTLHACEDGRNADKDPEVS
jgi:hypothetical protein